MPNDARCPESHHDAILALVMIRLVLVALLPFLTLGRPTPSSWQADQRAPNFRVQVWGEVPSGFQERIDAYAELRRELERGLPPLRVTADAGEIVQRVRRLGEKLRAARRDAKAGDLFTPTVSAALKNALGTQTNPTTCAALFDDNPGPLALRINATYPTHQPWSTMPANILAVLPRLPDDIEYRMEGHHLLLVDMRARLLVDVMRFAIQC